MKKLTLYIVMALLSGVSTYGQSYVNVTEKNYAIIGDSVRVEMKIDYLGAKISNNSFILLTPSLRSELGSMELPSVMFNGKASQKSYKRAVYLGHGPVNIKTALTPGNKKTAHSYDYATTVPYELWMSKAQLMVNEKKYACNDNATPISSKTVAQTIENRNPPSPPPTKSVEMNYLASFKVPAPEAVKLRSESGKAYLDFVLGRSDIKPDFKNNAYELEKIEEMILSVKNNPYATITRVKIEGNSSPDGNYSTNLRLSSARAISLKDYIRRNYTMRESLFSVTGMGEDWATFDTLVSASMMVDKDKVLSVIRSAQQPDIKERNLKSISGGAVFAQLSNEIFSKLRRCDYELQYTIIPFTVETGKNVFQFAPSNLSLNEMFLIAESYEPNTMEYSKVFEVAAKIYPDSDISNLNAAANALANHDTKTAEVHLRKVSDHDASWHNNMGVMSAIAGDFDTAIEHFTKAQGDGNKEAAHNLNEIRKSLSK